MDHADSSTLPPQLAALRTAGERLIAHHFGTVEARLNRNRKVLDVMLRHLTADGGGETALPIQLTRRTVQAIEAELSGRDRYAPESYRRRCALAWLCARFAEEQLVDGARPTVSRQRYRDLALRPTATAVQNANRLAATLTPALVDYLFDPARSVEEIGLAVLLEQIWEEAIVLSRPLPTLRALRWADTHPALGYLNLFLRGRAPALETPGWTEAPLRVFQSDVGRAVFNYYRFRTIEAGVVRPVDPTALVWPFSSGIWDPATPQALGDALTTLAAELSGCSESALSLPRFIEAARVRALDRFPPAIIAILSGKVRFAPMPDAEADPGSGFTPTSASATAPAAPTRPPIVRPAGGLVALRGSAIDDVEDGAPESGWCDHAAVSYDETLEGIRGLERKLDDPRQPTPREALAAEAKDLHAHIEGDLAAMGQSAPTRLRDLHLLLEYVVWQLQHPHGSPALRWQNSLGSIRARWNGLARLVDAFLGDQALCALTEEEWGEFALEMMTVVPRAPRTRKRYRQMARSLHTYLTSFHNSSQNRIATVDWSSREFQVALSMGEYSVLRPWEFERALARLGDEKNSGWRKLLTIAAIVAYDTGARRLEVSALPIDGVIGGIEPLLDIRRSKTRNGLRYLPLRPLMPTVHADLFFWPYCEARWIDSGGNPNAPFLGVGDALIGPDPREVARRIATVLKRTTRKAVSYHSLRHGFSSLFLLRWFVATYGRDVATFLGPLLDTPWFSAGALAEFRRLFIPEGTEGAWPGRPLLVLARLMGHGNPEITINVYVHSMDWLQRLYLDLHRHRTGDICLSIAQAAAALRESQPTIYTHFPEAKGGEGVPCRKIVARQVELLGQHRRLGRRPRRLGQTSA